MKRSLKLISLVSPDHRNISKQTQHYTAKAMGDALLERQGENIPAIQEVDAIIDQRRHRQIVCECKVHPRS